MRFGFLGASRIGARAVGPAVLAAGHDIVAVAARDAARARVAADGFGAVAAYGDYAALLADPAVEAVYIALTNDQHLPWTLAALQAGKHVLCEKPLALNAAEVARMRDAAAAAGRVVAEAFCHIHHPQFARLSALLAEGAVGSVRGIQASFMGTMPEGDFRWSPAMGGGSLYDLGTYCVCLMRLLVGEPVAVAATQVGRGGVDATFAGQLHFPDGASGQFQCSFEAAPVQHLLLRGTTGELRLVWPISTKGRATRLWLNGAEEHFASFDPYVPMVANFVAHAGGEGGLLFDIDQSLAHAKVMDALFAAAATGEVVRLR